MSQGQHPLFCFPMASALTMTVFEVRTRVLPVQDPLSASGAGPRCGVGQKTLDVLYVG